MMRVFYKTGADARARQRLVRLLIEEVVPISMRRRTNLFSCYTG